MICFREIISSYRLQFSLMSQKHRHNEVRMQDMFIHFLPLYPYYSPEGTEGAEAAFGNKLLISWQWDKAQSSWQSVSECSLHFCEDSLIRKGPIPYLYWAFLPPGLHLHHHRLVLDHCHCRCRRRCWQTGVSPAPSLNRSQSQTLKNKPHRYSFGTCRSTVPHIMVGGCCCC